ncbi:PP-loop superfamily ATPase-like protein [Anaeromyxobacter dehalogenans 2CP-1]|uniref:PP-loop superfamily ATPase-like protein n=1 Tax=Anaeromyxobacter dehalogenans (strain ATCC BAA-258 / DSM 21875 / 2CP-1) TaxID=455488 RepID=B8JF98_ANAD2|nr:7-cyano-7-deazaguanine synthase [Anaeromyxobacter dehalogenans]ACL64455.1 PP-loop superfamily ATPase-like protein [Anaeromyxobacter dehalogenans 2CP-1]
MKSPAYRYEVDGGGRIVVSHGGGTHILTPKLTADTVERSWLAPFARPERDLIRVAAAIHSVDRLSRRIPQGTKGLERELHWQRRLHVKLAVEDPDRWAAARERVARLLAFMTDDEWNLTFASCSDHLRPQPLFTENCENAEVGLFSGGLDSIVGTYLRSRTAKKLIVVSVHGIQVRASAQQRAITMLQRASFFSVPLHWVSFDHQLRHAHPPEKSQRCRGFLFLSIGAAVARTVGASTLHTYENGIGALNPPMNLAQVGAQNTRAMHPGTLASLEGILEVVQDDPVRLEAPFLFSTKGEMCRDAREHLIPLAQASNSCDEGEHGKPDPAEHCGLCTSCLLRRSALFAALGDKDPTPYRNRTSSHDDYDVLAFEQQARRFGGMQDWSTLLRSDPSLALIASYSKRRGTAPAVVADRIRDLFGRHRAELDSFYAARRPRPKIASSEERV